MQVHKESLNGWKNYTSHMQLTRSSKHHMKEYLLKECFSDLEFWVLVVPKCNTGLQFYMFCSAIISFGSGLCECGIWHMIRILVEKHGLSSSTGCWIYSISKLHSNFS